MHKTLISLLLVISNCAVSQSTSTTPGSNSNNEVVYPNNLWLAIGNEPFWNVEIEVGKHIIFTSIGDIDSVRFAYVEPVKNVSGRIIYKIESKEGRFELLFKKEKCIDGMSNNLYSYSTALKFRKENSNSTLELEGCGKFITPTALNDIWVLTELNGEKVKVANVPTMELHLKNNKVMGNAGCNGYQGNFTLGRDLIKFDRNMIATRMYCEDQNIESAFLGAIAGNRFVYEIAHNQLILKTEGHPILVFKKVD